MKNIYEKIVIGFDGSASSRLALQKACELGERFGSELNVVLVIEPLDVYYGEPIPDVEISKQKETANMIIEKAKKIAANYKIKNVNYMVKYGVPANEIMKTATDIKADLIVVGRKSKKGLLEKVLLGSVSQSIVNLSKDIDVLITPYIEPTD
ncbi:MAG: universal stress protein [Fervidicoccus sp.]